MTSEHSGPGLVELPLRGRHGNTLFVPGLEEHTSAEQSLLESRDPVALKGLDGKHVLHAVKWA